MYRPFNEEKAQENNVQNYVTQFGKTKYLLNWDGAKTDRDIKLKDLRCKSRKSPFRVN